MLGMNQEQRTELKTLLSQKMIQSAEILQMDTQELETYIEEQAAENPMIDLDQLEKRTQEGTDKTSDEDARAREIMQKKLEWLNRSDEQNRVYYAEEAQEEADREAWNISVDDNSLQDYLMGQLLLDCKTPEDRNIMEFLVESLDERGYLTDAPSELAAHLGISETMLSPYLSLLKSLEPAGVGAASLQECLLLQIERLSAKGAIEEEQAGRLLVLVRDHLTQLGKNHFTKAAQALSVSREQLETDYKLIQSLNPIPGNAFGSRKEMRYVKPDVAVVKFESYFEVLVNEMVLPRVSVNNYYLSLMKETDSAEVKDYLEEKYRQLTWVRRCIGERSDTLKRVTKEIVRQQEAFFESPAGKRRPMGLKDVAQNLDIHESTVSRTIKNKFLQCQRGVYPLSYFFQRTASTDEITGAGLTPERMKRRITELIEAENKQKPLSDQRIADMLELEGMPLSRRTVAKYRAELLLPDAAGRRM